MLCAAIDIGTVTTRLLLCDVCKGKLSTLERRISFTNLGKGLTSSGAISDEAEKRLLATLLEYREVLRAEENRFAGEQGSEVTIPVKIVATSAMRDAANAKQICTRLGEAGITVDIISGTREAELSFKGMLSGFDAFESAVMSIDVGGGSTELIMGTSEQGVIFSRSFDIGSRRITELFLCSDPPSTQQLCEARAWVEGEIRAALASLPVTHFEVVAVAGAATSAITIRDTIEAYDRSLVHGKRLSATELDELIRDLAAMNLEERKQVTGLQPERAPVIIGGLLILSVVLDALGKESVVIGDSDLLQGIILDEVFSEATIC